MSQKIIQVNCPRCKVKFEYYTSDFRPFCSERCKMVDMGKWLTEAHVIKGKDGEAPSLEFENEIEEKIEAEFETEES